MRYPDLSLRTKFFLAFCLVGILPLLCLGFVLAQVSATAVEGQTFLLMGKLVNQINRTIEYNVSDTERLSLTPFADQEIQDILRNNRPRSQRERLMDRRALDRMMFTMDFLRSDIVAINVYARDGEIYSRSSLAGYEIPRDLSAQKWYRKTLQAKGSKVISTGARSMLWKPYAVRVLSLTRVIMDRELHESIGLILIDTDMSLIARICHDSSIGEQGSIALLDEDGGLLYSSAEEGGSPNELSPMPAEESRLFGHFKGIDVVTKYRLDRKELVVASTYSRATGLTTISLVPLADLDQGGVLLRWEIGILLLLCLSASMVAAFFIARSITGPVRMLRERMLRAESGDFGSEPMLASRDEIGQLAIGFTTMLGKLDHLVKSANVAELRQKESELRALQSQINPHFLYNTLEVIRGIALESGVRSVVDISRALGGLLRYSLGKGPETVTLADELGYIRDFLAIQKYRFGERFETRITIDQAHLGTPLLRLSLQPLVENSLLHGIEAKSGKGLLTISSTREGAFLVISIADDGAGMPAERLKTIQGAITEGHSGRLESVGFLNVHERLRLAFGDASGLWIESEQGRGTTVTLRVPCEGGS